MRIVVSGGGSAGHITPILAVVAALKKLNSNVELLYLGQAGGMEERMIAAAGIEFAPIRAGKFRRLHNASRLNKLFNPATLGLNARDSAEVMGGIVDSLRRLRAYRPDVVFIKGGFVGLPVGLAAWLLKIPFVIHESDVSPGLANRILSRWATKIAVGFPACSYHDFDKARLVFVGNPVRPELLKAHRLEGMAKFNLTEKMPVILVTGGSLGAATINDLIVEALPILLPKYQIIHLTGEHELERIGHLVDRMNIPDKDRYHYFGFLANDMAAALAAADVVVARAGANTIAELAALGKSTVLIPNYKMAGHQVDNAKQVARSGAARVITEQQLTAELLISEIDRILESEEEQRHLTSAMKQFVNINAAQDLAKLIVKTAGREVVSGRAPDDNSANDASAVGDGE